MNSIDQRKQWADHMNEEALAREVQQEAAGQSHSPVEGPLPYSANDLDDAVAAAVEAERQRCARVAESWSAEAKLLDAFGDFTEWELRAGAATAQAVANDIRRGA